MEGAFDTELQEAPGSYRVHIQHFPSRGVQLPTLFRPYKHLPQNQDGPKDSISKWLITQTPAGLMQYDLALAGSASDPPGPCLQSLYFAGVCRAGLPESAALNIGQEMTRRERWQESVG